MKPNNTILLIDEQSESYSRILRSGFFRLFDLKYMPGPDEALDYLKTAETNIDIVLTETNFGGTDRSAELIGAIKAERPDIPVIVISIKTSPVDAALALENGADDYIRKPFDEMELAARLKRVLSRYAKEAGDTRNGEVIRLNGLVINKSAYTVSACGSEIKMPPKEIDLLYYLASSPDNVFSRKDLLGKIWGYDYFGGTRTVDIHVNRIRGKLSDHDCSWSIVTVWGKGYKLTNCSAFADQRG